KEQLEAKLADVVKNKDYEFAREFAAQAIASLAKNGLRMEYLLQPLLNQLQRETVNVVAERQLEAVAEIVKHNPQLVETANTTLAAIAATSRWQRSPSLRSQLEATLKLCGDIIRFRIINLDALSESAEVRAEAIDQSFRLIDEGLQGTLAKTLTADGIADG